MIRSMGVQEWSLMMLLSAVAFDIATVGWKFSRGRMERYWMITRNVTVGYFFVSAVMVGMLVVTG